MTREETLQRARQAAEILEHPLVVEAFARLRADIDAHWHSSSAADVGERERLYHLHRATDDLEAHFRSLVSDGKFAAGRQRQDDAQAQADADGAARRR
jgi:hypothetical protein